MDRNRRSRPGQRMTRMSFGNSRGRLSMAEALGALLAVAALAALAVGLIGGTALADRGLGASAQTARAPTVVRTWTEPPMDLAPMPEVPADAEEAQPMATF